MVFIILVNEVFFFGVFCEFVVGIGIFVDLIFRVWVGIGICFLYDIFIIKIIFCN